MSIITGGTSNNTSKLFYGLEFGHGPYTTYYLFTIGNDSVSKHKDVVSWVESKIKESNRWFYLLHINIDTVVYPI